jgi:hypothetical protein
MTARSTPHDYAVTLALAALATLARDSGTKQRTPYQERATHILTAQIERLCRAVPAVARANVSTRDAEFRRTVDSEVDRLVFTLHAHKRRALLGTAADRKRLANLIRSFASHCALPTSDIMVVRLVDPRLTTSTFRPSCGYWRPPQWQVRAAGFLSGLVFPFPGRSMSAGARLPPKGSNWPKPL